VAATLLWSMALVDSGTRCTAVTDGGMWWRIQCPLVAGQVPDCPRHDFCRRHLALLLVVTVGVLAAAGVAGYALIAGAAKPTPVQSAPGGTVLNRRKACIRAPRVLRTRSPVHFP
jgi:hypothetical protein